MAGIMDFVTQASGSLGIGEDKARSATGALLGAIQGGADKGDFQKLLGALPGAADLVKGAGAAPAASGGGGLGGMLGGLGGAAAKGGGGLMDVAGGLLGGKAGGALSLLGALQGAGLDASKGGSFVTMFLAFVKEKAGAGLLSSLTSKMPELAKFLK